jgi:hypothetical protein
MSLHRIVLVLTLMFAFAASNAHAFFDPPWITPTAPRAGEAVSVNMRMGICDARVERPGYPQITIQGNTIRLLVYGHHWETQDLCIYPVGLGVEPIGTFPPGDYTVTVDFAYENYPLGLTIIPLGVIPFTVTGVTPAASVPATTTSGRLAFLMLVAGAALWALRRRRRSKR